MNLFARLGDVMATASNNRSFADARWWQRLSIGKQLCSVITPDVAVAAANTSWSALLLAFQKLPPLAPATPRTTSH